MAAQSGELEAAKRRAWMYIGGMCRLMQTGAGVGVGVMYSTLYRALKSHLRGHGCMIATTLVSTVYDRPTYCTAVRLLWKLSVAESGRYLESWGF